MTSGAMDREPAEDQGSTLDGFADLLADAFPDVFTSARNVRAFFDNADEHFTIDENIMHLDSPCTKSASTTCWAARVQPAWNRLFNKRGVEMIQLHKGSYHFRTLNISPEKLEATYDVKYLCQYLWLLRQHRCISGVVFSLSVVAPRHGPLFMSLLRLTPCVQKFEMRISDSFRGSSAHSWLNALDGLSQLRELSLCNMRLSDSDVTILARIVERSEFLVTLILIDVEVGSVAFRELTTKVGQNDTLKDLRLKTIVKKPKQTFTEALSEIGKSRLARLYVHLDGGLRHLLEGFKNSLLTELALEPMVRDCDVLAVLADFLKREKLVQHLKVRLDTREMDAVPGALDNLARIISESSLILLVLSGSKLTAESARRLANALGESGKVLELHLDECDLVLDDVRPFVDAVKRRSEMDEFVLLNLGVLQGECGQKRDLVSHIKEHNLLEQILLVYDADVGSTLLESLEEGLKLVHVHLSFATSEVSVESVLHALTYAPWNLESISIISDQVVGGSAGQSLRYIIENVHSLKVLKILCILLPVTTGEVCDALANSQSVMTLAIGGWIFDTAAEAKLVQTLGINRSLCRLEFHCTDKKDCSSRRELLDRALCRSLTVWIAEVYCGQELQEIDAPGSGPNHIARANEMAISWTADVILGRGHCDAGSGLFDVLDVCEAPLDLFKRANYFVPRPCGNQALAPYMATRSIFYSLFSAFFAVKEFVHCPKAMASFRRILDIKRREAWQCAGLAPLPLYEEVLGVECSEEDLFNFDVNGRSLVV